MQKKRNFRKDLHYFMQIQQITYLTIIFLVYQFPPTKALRK